MITTLATQYRDRIVNGWYRMGRAAGAEQTICRHREWTKFGTYSEPMLCRLLDDLC